MNTMHKTRSSGDSCSCTTCVYKSESDHPSLRRIIDLGSRIDRLYYGKYIPLRERKLLERLVRTRAVYDDIRAQLVSDSTLNLSTKGDYNPRKRVSARDLDDTEKSSGAVLELVNMVDRGAIGSKKLEDCCSCCSCSSKIKLHETRHRQQRTYDGMEEYLARQRRIREHYRKKGVRFKTKHIRSDPCTCTFKLIKRHSKAIYKKMHQKPYIPLLELQPDEEIKVNRKIIGDIARTSYQNLKDSNTHIKEKISEGMSKLRESQIRIQEKIELQTKLSIEKLKQAKGRLASKTRSGAQKIWEIIRNEGPENELSFQVKKDSISKFKEELRRKQFMRDWECEPECIEEYCIPEKCLIKLQQKRKNQKNVHHKGMRYNIKTQERKTGETLRQSNYKIQAQNLANVKTIETNRPVLRAQRTRGITGSLVSLNKAPKKIQHVPVPNEVIKKNEISLLKIVSATPVKSSVQNVKASRVAKKIKKENSSLDRLSNHRQAVRIGSSFSFNIEFFKDKPKLEIPKLSSQSYRDPKQYSGIDYRYKKPVTDKKLKNRHLRQQGSQKELKKSLKDTQTGGHALKRCFCTLKLKAKSNKQKIRRSVTKKIMTTETSTFLKSPTVLTLNDVQTNTDNKHKKGRRLLTKKIILPYECEPGVCVPGQCDPYQCIEFINIREAKQRHSSTQPRKTKYTSSFTSYNLSKPKNVQHKFDNRGKVSKSIVGKQLIRRENAISNSHRQAVHIGSTFSFNVEFYKDNPYNQYHQITRPSPPLELKSLSIKPKQHRKVKLKHRGYQGNLGNLHRNTPTQMIKKERNAGIGTSLRRCFCTLALQRKDIRRHSIKTLTIGTETSELKPIDTASRGTKTKSKYSRPLDRYECEPNTCVAGACDPYICLERINMRKKDLQGGSNLDRYVTPLESFECEPFTCIPGECNPYVCLERINKRNNRVKEVGLATGRSHTTSSSSGYTYPKKYLKTARVQYKPRHKERKVLAEIKNPQKYVKNNNNIAKAKYPANIKSGQAVKIGSTFSFNIEFHKNTSPKLNELKQMKPAEKKFKTIISTKSMNKGVKNNHLNVAQVKTQVQGPTKRDRGSVVGPLLKRCFCTLNLQKKWKHQHSNKEFSSSRRLLFKSPIIYTVNRVMIKQGKPHKKYQSPLFKNFTRILSRDQICKALSVVHNINSHQTIKCDPIKVRSDIEAEKHMLKISHSQGSKRSHSQQRVSYIENIVENTVNARDFTKNSSLSSHIHKTRLASLTRYFQRCFYTMNLKVETRENFKEHEDRESRSKKRKLLPYECEPGVCIPGECNPYECQKIIAKRFLKKASKRSGSIDSSHSMSSSARQRSPKSKIYKQQTIMKKPKRLVFKTISQDFSKRSENKQKKAVRLGSSFSFDIEFSKKLSTSHKKVILPKHSSDTNFANHRKQSFESRSTGKRTKNFDSQSQSVSIKTVHRGSYTKPHMKRCFCTLKLQKKGRLHKTFENQTNQLLSHSINKLKEEKSVSRGQNTPKVKTIRHVLKPYECEPNVCIPGQCDPYQCLKRIKSRHYHESESGTNTAFYKRKSVSSMNTNDQRKIIRNRAVGAKPKIVTNAVEHREKRPEFGFANPSREAVRVGSTFSFNIEFFKDKPLPQHFAPTSVREKTKDKKHLRQPSPSLKKHTDSYSQNKIKFQHKQSQFENFARHASTLTNSFIKRCFCTASLYKSKNTNDIITPERNNNSPSFMKRCFCVLKKMKPRINSTIMNPKETKDKQINTRKIKDKQELELYECKPGICVPGECDPYTCDQIMRKYRYENSKATTADIFKTRSISSNSVNAEKKNVNTLIKSKGNQRIKHRGIKEHRIGTTASINNPNATSWSPNRNVVRIGSNFSFDIEFFKDHPLNVKYKQNSVPQKATFVKHSDNKKKVKNIYTKSYSPSYNSQSSQVKKQKVINRGIGINNFINRCFCTLKLNYKNKNKYNPKRKDFDDSVISKKVNTRSVMTVENRNVIRNALLPYECEPNTCVPYECDPYECKQRIKLRHKNQFNREFGVSTTSPDNISRYSITNPMKSTAKSQYIMTKKLRQRGKYMGHKYSDVGKVGKSKQSIRIGSTFSFDIEFYKNKQEGLELKTIPRVPKEGNHNDLAKYQIKGPRKKNKNQVSYGNKMNTNSINTHYTQFPKQVMRTQSTVTGSEPKKRCFCTLSLKKSRVKSPLSVKTLNASTETDGFKTNIPVSNFVPYKCEPNICIPDECIPVQCLEKRNRRQGTLLPYECEPNVCIPGECNPVQCLERIKKRQSTLLPFECEPNVCVPGECNPVQCLERIKKRHKTLGTTMMDSPRKTFGTLTEEPLIRSIATKMKRERYIKNRKAQSKQMPKINSKLIQKQIPGSNNKRQAIRIGSNFSFDIEFFKTNNLNNYANLPEPPKYYKSNNYANLYESPKYYKTKQHLRNKASNSNYEKKKRNSRGLQSISPTKSQGSSMPPFLKRCFCTLKLQKMKVNEIPITGVKHLIEPKQLHISSENKSTATKKFPIKTHKNTLSPFECEPFYCIPGECDPYECAKRIEIREKKHKTQYTITQPYDQSHKGVDINLHNMKSQRSQASFIDRNAVASTYRPEIVEIPRFTNIFNRQAVRIGSNVSFNIEFYKENLLPTSDNFKQVKHDFYKVKDEKIKKRGYKNIHHREQNTAMTRLRSSESGYDKTKMENKSVEAENILKRCFCTLKLHNNISSSNKEHGMNKMQYMNHFSQNVEVRRVAVKHKPNILRSQQKQIGVKSVVTKINKKQQKTTDFNAPCNLYYCQSGETFLPEELKTILPYMPEKFNKTVSKIALPVENKYNKLREPILTNRGKRLTRKRSKKKLHHKLPKIPKTDVSNKHFLRINNFINRCTRIFHPMSNSENVPHTDTIRHKTLLDITKSSKNDNQVGPKQLIPNLKTIKCQKTCPHYLVYQSGNTEHWPPGISVNLNNKEIIKTKSLNKKSNTKQQHKEKPKDRACTCSIKLASKKQNTKSKSLSMSNNGKMKFKKHRDHLSPLRVRFLDTAITKDIPQSEKINSNLSNSKSKRFASGTKSDRVIQPYCLPCKGNVTKEEFHKAAGDQLSNQKVAKKQRILYGNVDKMRNKIKDKMRCAMNAEEPVFEMQVDSRNYEILNRNEVIENVAKLKTKCKPLIEVQVDPNMRKVINKGALIDDITEVNARIHENSLIGSMMEYDKDQEKVCPCRRGPASKVRKLTGKPCICGSPVCARKVENMKEPIIRKKWKTCVCGSPICDIESAKIQALSDYVENKCLCRKEMARRKAKTTAEKEKKEAQEREIRLKLYEKSDEIRRKERKKEQKRLERKIDKKASDGVLFAESVLDVGKLGITATVDLLRQVARVARDPKHAVQTLRTLEENPMLIAKFLQSTYHDTGLSGTLRRIRLRCLAMRGVIKLRRKLESYPLTNYLLNIASNDPRRRIIKKKAPPIRERERFDFNCSLYMGSLRKRPFLSVYDRCPWFYQHFLALVHAWKQFIDICLFLLAAVVWSPCILAMEICRACMCCFFCTG